MNLTTSTSTHDARAGGRTKIKISKPIREALRIHMMRFIARANARGEDLRNPAVGMRVIAQTLSSVKASGVYDRLPHSELEKLYVDLVYNRGVNPFKRDYRVREIWRR